MLSILLVYEESNALADIAELLYAEDGWDIIAASGARQAMDVLCRQKVDIVFCEIRMKDMSCMDFLEDVMSKWPFCKIIFNSDYCDCKLARATLSKGAFGYLLKDEGNEAIMDEIRRCEECINNEMGMRIGPDEVLRKVEAASPLLKNATLLNVLEWMPHDMAKKELAVLSINIDVDEPLLLVAASIDNFLPKSNSHERFLTMVEVEEIFNRYLSQRFRCHRASKANKTMIWILQSLGGNDSGLLYCKQTLDTVQQAVQKALGLSLSIVYDDFVQYEYLHDRYRHLLSILEQIIIQGEGQVLADSKFYIDRRGSNPADSSGRYLRDMELVRQTLATGDSKQFYTALQRVLYSKENNTTARKLQTYHTVCDIVLEYIENTGLGEDVFSQPEQFEMFKEYEGRNTFLIKMSALVTALIQIGRKLQASRNDALILGVQNYIIANLAGNLSLQAIADSLYINSAYLSRVYKRRTGITIGEEITARRIELAKRMLLRSDYKIYEIARDAGFESAAYFTRVFKKKEGINPQSWRESQL